MLSSLFISNLALIKNSEINFSNGFNVILGQSGAGKSILIDALSFVLGAKADKTLLRTGEKVMRVEAVFDDVPENIKQILTSLDIDFDGELAALAAARVPRGTLMINYTPTKNNDDPKYYSHFTVAKLKDGRYSTIELSNPDVDMGAAGALSAIFTRPVELEVGDYMLVSGTRMANGTVLSQVQFFSVEEGKQTTLDMTMREDDHSVQVIGTMNPEARFVPKGASEPQSILATTGRGYFVLALLEAKKEPTNHAMRDIAALKSELEQWNRGLVFLFASEDQLAAFDPAEFGSLPNTITYRVDQDGSVSAMLKQSLELTNMNDLPVFVVADTFGRVVFVSQGYRIGMGEQMMKIINSL